MNNSSLKNGLFKLVFCFTIFISFIVVFNLNTMIITAPPTYGVPGIAMQLFANDNNIVKNTDEFIAPVKNTASPLVKNNFKESKEQVVKKEPAKKIKAHTNKTPQELGDISTQVIPVAYDGEAPTAKQIFMHEQVSGSDKTILKAYNAVKVNGEWVLTPAWIITENFSKDSTGNIIIDSSVNNQQ